MADLKQDPASLDNASWRNTYDSGTISERDMGIDDEYKKGYLEIITQSMRRDDGCLECESDSQWDWLKMCYCGCGPACRAECVVHEDGAFW